MLKSNTEIYIVLEYMQGGELYDVILDKGKLTSRRHNGRFTSIKRYCIYGRPWNYTS